MKKRYLVFGLLTVAYSSFGQTSKKQYSRKKLSHSDVETVFSYYNQNNDHSAVTGGIGTEALQVYAYQFSLDNIKDSVRTVHIDAGFDVISSASTDNIDFVLSSASKTDLRVYTSLGYSKPMKDRRTTLGAKSSFSIESDYLSLGQYFSFHHVSSQATEINAALQLYFDDLRWGRYQVDGTRELVYPVELRNMNWFDKYRRNSYNLIVGINQTINRRMTLGIYPGFTYQSGLLSTTFHRVYFTDNSKRVENLPGSRIKIPIGIQLNTFVGTRWIIRAYYRYYWDDFGISGNTFSMEVPLKASRLLTITPFIRVYSQSKSDFFKPYGEHLLTQEFYTSDYDLSHFHSLNSGLGLRYAPYSNHSRTTFKSLELRFAHYKRSDGLTANNITLYLNYDKEGKVDK